MRWSALKKTFEQLPTALQRVIAQRIAAAAVFTLCFLVTFCSFGDVYLFLPSLLFAGFFTMSAIHLLLSCITGDCISVSGTSVQTEKTAIRKRLKSLTLEYEEDGPKNLTVFIRGRMKCPEVGDAVTVYLSKKTPVYGCDGAYRIYSYYAVQIRKEAQT